MTRRSVLKEARGLDAMEKVNIRFSSKARGELKLREGGREGRREREGWLPDLVWKVKRVSATARMSARVSARLYATFQPRSRFLFFSPVHFPCARFIRVRV